MNWRKQIDAGQTRKACDCGWRLPIAVVAVTDAVLARAPVESDAVAGAVTLLRCPCCEASHTFLQPGVRVPRQGPTPS